MWLAKRYGAAASGPLRTAESPEDADDEEQSSHVRGRTARRTVRERIARGPVPWPDYVHSDRVTLTTDSRAPSPEARPVDVSMNYVYAAAVAKAIKWIVDSGASNHMISRKDIHNCGNGQIFHSTKAVPIATANGVVETTERVYVAIPTLGISVEAIVMEHCPRRCHWVA